MERNIASKYIKDNFEPSDRLAVVLLDKRNDKVIQRIATAEQIAADRWGVDIEKVITRLKKPL